MSELPVGVRPGVWISGGILAAILGFTAVVLPAVYQEPIVSLMTWSIGSRMGYLFMSGLVAGFVSGAPPWLTGASTMVLFPIWSLVDMVVAGPLSHTLLGLEFIIYAIFAIPAVIGAGVGIVVRALLRYKRVEASVFRYGA